MNAARQLYEAGVLLREREEKFPRDIKKKRARKAQKTIYGYELILNLYQCDITIISSKAKLQEYVDKLCKLIKMKKYGKTLLPYFGEKAEYTKGYSLVQLIETSSITGHFSDSWKRAYINIFSCQRFDPQIAKEFTHSFFRAKKVKAKFLIR